MASNKKPALGRGLSALLEGAHSDLSQRYTTGEGMLGSISSIPVQSIAVNPFQPRKHFQKEALVELAESIRVHGLIQPITVRSMGDGSYQLISGERRFRASQAAGLTEIPAYVRVADDQAMLEMAIVENIQREDLDPVEVAIGYQRLLEECDLTHEELSEKVSKSRSNITNFLRLLKLPATVQLALREKVISMGHARALINLPDEDSQVEALRKIIEGQLSVRDTELLSKQAKSGSTGKKAAAAASLGFDEKLLVNRTSEYLNQLVDVRKSSRGKGKLIIPFNNDEEFKQLLQKILKD
jgi:ParB family chromosome partitioning protein